jgi:hypothetical protein
MSLDPETEQLKSAFFAGQKCCKCGGPAERFWKNQFYCGAHFLSGSARAQGSPRVYRHSRRPEK